MSAGPERPGWFNPIAAFLGDAYWAPDTTRVQAFTTGTEQEVDFLVAAFDSRPVRASSTRDVGPAATRSRSRDAGSTSSASTCRPSSSRSHRLRLQRSAWPSTRDSRPRTCASSAFDGEFDAVICLCQGGFGLLGGGDDEGAVLERFARALRPGGRLAVSAFNAYFALRHLEAGDTFDAFSGVNHERATLRDAGGNEREFDLWTTCFTPRELILLARAAGLEVDAVHGVTPGRYAVGAAVDRPPEHLLLAHRN